MGDAPDESTVGTYRAVMKTVGVDLETVGVDGEGTLVRSMDDNWRITIGSLPRLTLADAADPPEYAADLRLIDVLGEGGMGTVWKATQVNLDRNVAVKQLVDRRRSDRHELQLLREAWVTGALEHPNIVPVHNLGRTADGGPLIVMKYIEGTPWHEGLRALYGPDGEIDPEQTERQLGVFIQICNAISFAHSRGILHRDLKPGNIMIGAFGEVYVVDWGLAVALQPGGKIPTAHERKGLEGTPGYMAPEMARCDSAAVDQRTDVFLLGATLHKLVVGGFRNRGGTVVEMLASAYASEPYEYGARVPAELAHICNAACAKSPDDRFDGVQALRDAIADFLRHRSSRRLADGAHERLAAIEASLAADHSPPGEGFDPSAWATEARFGFKQALLEWADNAQALAGLQRTVELMIDHELQHRDPRVAAALLPELPEPRPELEQQVDELSREVRADKERVVKLERQAYEASLDVAVRSRRRASWVLGSVLAIPIGALFISRMLGLHKAGYPDALLVTGVFALAVGYTSYDLSKYGGNEANMRLMASMGVGCVALFTLFAIGAITGIDLTVSLSMAMVVSATVAGSVAAALDRRLAGAAVGFLLTAAGVLLWPEYRGAVLAVGCFASFAIGTIPYRAADEPPR